MEKSLRGKGDWDLDVDVGIISATAWEDAWCWLLLLLVIVVVVGGCIAFVLLLLMLLVVVVYGVVEDERAKSTTVCPIVFIAPVECEFTWLKWCPDVEIIWPDLPTTNVTLSTTDFKVATACSCVTFSKFLSTCKK